MSDLDDLVRDAREFSDRFMDQVKHILGHYLIHEAPLSVDRKCNADLIIPGGGASVRVRRHQYIKYVDDFTIRLARPLGTQTELEKIERGWGDWLLYGFANAQETLLVAWTLIDLSVFKQHYRNAPHHEQWHPDGSALFGIFRWADFPREMFVACCR